MKSLYYIPLYPSSWRYVQVGVDNLFAANRAKPFGNRYVSEANHGSTYAYVSIQYVHIYTYVYTLGEHLLFSSSPFGGLKIRKRKLGFFAGLIEALGTHQG